MIVDRKKHLAQTVAVAVGDMVVRRREILDEDGGSYHDYILRRHWDHPNPRKVNLSGVRVQQTHTAITQARTDHEKRGGAPVPQTRVAVPIKVGTTAARTRHNRLGGAPLPPVKRR